MTKNVVELKRSDVLTLSEGTHLRHEEFGGLVVSHNCPALRLNESAVFVFELCDGKRSIEDVINEIAKRLSVSAVDIEGKVINFLYWMLQYSVLRRIKK